MTRKTTITLDDRQFCELRITLRLDIDRLKTLKHLGGKVGSELETLQSILKQMNKE